MCRAQVITGSRLALVWANIAVAPVNGYSLFSSLRPIRLPTTVPLEQKLAAWRQLQSVATAPLPEALFQQSPDHYAGLSFFCRAWEEMGRPSDVPSFCESLYKDKCIRRCALSTRCMGQKHMRTHTIALACVAVVSNDIWHHMGFCACIATLAYLLAASRPVPMMLVRPGTGGLSLYPDGFLRGPRRRFVVAGAAAQPGGPCGRRTGVHPDVAWHARPAHIPAR